MKLQITLIKYEVMGEYPQHEEKVKIALDYESLKARTLFDIAEDIKSKHLKTEWQTQTAEIKIKFIEDLI